jgi:hypothetical protein
MADGKNVSKRKSKKNKVATSEVGAPTTYSYGKSGGKGRANMTPTKATDKSY